MADGDNREKEAGVARAWGSAKRVPPSAAVQTGQLDVPAQV
jgi:hypothetical protein